ncbi:MAG: TRAP transporter small permease [Rhodovibrionaceae bacterium]
MINAIDSAVRAVAATLVAATVVFTCLAVFFRYVLNSALGWPQEVSGYILVWISFLGAYLASRESKHVSFDVVVDKLPAKLRRVIMLTVDLMLIGYFLILFRMSLRMIEIVGHRNIETLDIPFGVFMAILPLASILIVLSLVLDIVRRFRGREQ